MGKKSSIVSRDVANRGRIVIETKLDQWYYNYVTGSEEIALDRVAESLCDLTSLKEILPAGIEINLTSIVPIGELNSNKISGLLALEVVGFDSGYEEDLDFSKILVILGQQAAARLISRGKVRLKVELRYQQYLIVY